MDADTLHHLTADRKDRIQRSQRILKDHRHLISTDLIQLFFRHRKQLFSIEPDGAVRDFSASSEQPHN